MDKDAVIAAIYSAAMGVGEWSDALAALAELTETRCITIDRYDRLQRAGSVLASNIAPHQASEDYNREFGRNYPLIELSLSHLHPSAVYRTAQRVDNHDLLQSDLYNLVYRALGLKHVMSVFLEVSARSTTQYTVIRPEGAPDFSDREIAIFRELQPHLVQAWRGYCHLDEIRSRLHALTDLWDRFEHAVFVIDPERRLQFANRAAESMLRASAQLMASDGRLVLVDALEDGALQRALSDPRRAVQSLTLDPRGAEPNYSVTFFRFSMNRIALLVTDPCGPSSDFAIHLQTAFQLTTTEASLVDALISGISLRDFADTQGISYETARSHLKQAMHKNGWHRQGELIAAVLKHLLPIGTFSAAD